MPSSVAVCDDAALTFEQRRELLRLQTELKRLKLEERRLSLHAGEAARDPVGSSSPAIDIGGNLRLVPQFSEWEPDTFFCLFERVARVGAGLILNVPFCCSQVSGRAQKAYAALSVEESRV